MEYSNKQPCEVSKAEAFMTQNLVQSHLKHDQVQV